MFTEQKKLLFLGCWEYSKNIHFSRTDLEYLGVQDRVQQDSLLSAISALKDRRRDQDKSAQQDQGQDRSSKDRPVSRMDSGYYDGHRDSESDDLGKLFLDRNMIILSIKKPIN